MSKGIGTESYKGVRDFYPENQAVQNYIFNTWKGVCQKFGYEEYNASVLESADLYRAKSGEELVNEQTYTFTDRGDREVTLRPEMTPTVARMVAARRRELPFPLRWFSIPNLFRYEQPQRGRLREHWQLNADIFGVKALDAEVEIIQLAHTLMTTFGVQSNQFEIRLNNRKVMNYMFFDVLNLDAEGAHKIGKLIDKKAKIDAKTFREAAEAVIGDKVAILETLLNSKNFEEFTSNLPQTKEEHEGITEIKKVIAGLESLGITNIRFDQTLMRGFDYYTGIVFEVFDLNPENRRSVFGGGRYDDLLSIFGGDKVPAVGFGTGDVVTLDLLTSYNLLPKQSHTAQIALIPIDETVIPYTNELAQILREKNIATVIEYGDKKLGDKIKTADKRGIAYITVIGETEKASGKIKIKNLETQIETELEEDAIAEFLLK